MTQHRHALTDVQWQRMAVHLPPVLGRPMRDDRLFIDAVLWIAKTGESWRDLPAHLGSWAQVYQRFAQWSERGHFNALFVALQGRKKKRAFDALKYRTRHLVENLRQSMKVC